MKQLPLSVISVGIILIVGAVGIVAIGLVRRGGQVAQLSTQQEAANCDEALVAKSVEFFAGGAEQIDQLAPTVNEMESRATFRDSADCLFVASYYYERLGEVDKALELSERLDGVYGQASGYSLELRPHATEPKTLIDRQQRLKAVFSQQKETLIYSAGGEN